MKLDDFIKEVIVSIHSGLEKAEAETRVKLLPDGNIKVTDKIPHVEIFNDIEMEGFSRFKMISNIEFEVALTNTDTNGQTGGLGVFFTVLNVGASVKSEQEQLSRTKVKFNIPIQLGNDK